MNIKTRMRLNRALPWARLIVVMLALITFLACIGMTFFIANTPKLAAVVTSSVATGNNTSAGAK